MYCLTFTYISYKIIVNNYSAITVRRLSADVGRCRPTSANACVNPPLDDDANLMGGWQRFVPHPPCPM